MKHIFIFLSGAERSSTLGMSHQRPSISLIMSKTNLHYKHISKSYNKPRTVLADTIMDHRSNGSEVISGGMHIINHSFLPSKRKNNRP